MPAAAGAGEREQAHVVAPEPLGNRRRARGRARSARWAGWAGSSDGSRACAGEGNSLRRPSITSCESRWGLVRSLRRCSPRSRSPTPSGSSASTSSRVDCEIEYLPAVRGRADPRGARHVEPDIARRPERTAHRCGSRSGPGAASRRARVVPPRPPGSRRPRVGKATKNASPCVSTSRPPASAKTARRSRRCSASSAAYSALPSRASSSVDPSTSVNRKVTVPVGRPSVERAGTARSSDGSCTRIAFSSRRSDGGRLEAELVPEHHARLVVGGERVSLPARPIERENEQTAHALAQRVLLDQRFQLWHHLGMTAECEVGFEPRRERDQPQLLETADLGARERLVAEVGKRRAAPEIERIPEQSSGLAGCARCEHRAAALEEALELLQVERSRGRHGGGSQRRESRSGPGRAPCAAARRRAARPSLPAAAAARPTARPRASSSAPARSRAGGAAQAPPAASGHRAEPRGRPPRPRAGRERRTPCRERTPASDGPQGTSTRSLPTTRPVPCRPGVSFVKRSHRAIARRGGVHE